ncbi:hypothetical protein P152DRAFT_515675 [Eremomyces bilateralis CBS 781.70]|uniref:Uncharacterized protein n=1 Tax=Eremomyces bilateralis CBS 781.70 TaxID=1392243 RepID=A0A6G1FYX2_9PEZI|nr:uncharacterized protein P152DRAFT_515675 [Eremomyces bilateralis CBS 781.70]KAF1810890.1 hypothetical protein P152DRAFT_515675 [Eremomyces bilateralis CBS 781.70]
MATQRPNLPATHATLPPPYSYQTSFCLGPPLHLWSLDYSTKGCLSTSGGWEVGQHSLGLFLVLNIDDIGKTERESNSLSLRTQLSATMARIVSLPVEILEEIGEVIGNSYYPENLFDYRLTCSLLRDTSLRAFKDKYFSRRNHLLTEESLLCLLDIARDPALGPAIKSVTFATDGVCCGVHTKHTDLYDSDDSDVKGPTEFINEQKCRRDNDEDKMLLREIFARLKRCTEIAIVGPHYERIFDHLPEMDPTPWGLKRLRKNVIYGYLDDSSASSYVYRIVISAILWSEIPVKRLHIGPRNNIGGILLTELALPNFYYDILREVSFKQLETLELGVDTSSGPSLFVWHFVSGFLNTAPGISRLILSDSTHLRKQVGKRLFQFLAKEVNFNHLKELELNSWTLNVDDLLIFLRKHVNSIRSVSLVGIQLVDPLDRSIRGKNWSRLATALLEHFKIDRLLIAECMVHGDFALAHGDDGKGPLDIDASGETEIEEALNQLLRARGAVSS